MDDVSHIDSLIFSEDFIRDLSVNEDEWMRKAIFSCPTTKEALHGWIKLYLGLDFPDSIVDPTSNSSPMDMIWETYNAARLNNDPEFYRVMYYSCRGGYKTLGASVLELIMMLLLRRNVAHMAAIVQQSLKAQDYLKRFVMRPIIRDYVSRQSERRIEITRPDGSTNYIQVVVCTMAGANFEHVPFMVVDEIDVVAHPEAYEEAKFIPAPMEQNLPITLLTSTRKFSFGLVQREIDEADRTGLKIRHWNVLDITEHCPDTRCRPDLPKIPIYRSDNLLRAISEAEYTNLPSDKQAEYVRDEGFVGCLQNCPLFAMCKSRLATHQMCRSRLLKPLAHVVSEFRTVSLEKAKAQLLCWKPSKEGLVYTTLDPSLHFKTAAQIAEMIDGNPRPQTFGKVELIAFIAQAVQDGTLSLHAGVDWGYTHNYAFTLGVLDQQKRLFILDVLSMPEMELDQLIRITEELLVPYGGAQLPLLYPDNAYPAYIKTFRRHGFRCKDFKKDVQGGIEAARYGLMDSVGEARIYFLSGDDGVQLLWTRLNQYHWKLDAAGKATDEPDDELDDECDSVRYMAQNIFTQGKGILVSVHQTKQETLKSHLPVSPQPTYTNYLSQIIMSKLAERGGTHAKAKGQKGSLIYDIGGDAAEEVDPLSIVTNLADKGPKQS